MIKRKMLLVLGAGSSAEIGLPTSAKLRTKIASLLNITSEDPFQQPTADTLISAAIRRWCGRQGEGDINPTLREAWRIRDAMPQAISIDNYIDAHRGNDRIEICGKLAIVQAILEAERQSRLYFNPRGKTRVIDFGRSEKTWLKPLFQIITENCQFDDLPDRLRSLSFIVFNYDRCLEHYLYHSFQNYYGADTRQSAELVSLIDIYHPYGQVGYLPWQTRRPGSFFGGEPNAEELLSISCQIRTFTEGTNPKSSDINSIHKRIEDSSIVLFLGFSFHNLNMKLLKSELKDPSPKQCFATALGISSHDISIVAEDILKVTGCNAEDIYIRNDLACYDLFNEYWRSLAVW